MENDIYLDPQKQIEYEEKQELDLDLYDFWFFCKNIV